MDTGAGLTGDTVLGFLQQRDQGGAAGLGLGELHRGLDLGQHGALGELVLVHIDLGLGLRILNFYSFHQMHGLLQGIPFFII